MKNHHNEKSLLSMKNNHLRHKWSFLPLLILLLVACQPAQPAVLRLATTTSTADSGLLDAILPLYEEQANVRIDVVAVGTGQALALGEAGDADVLLVHARAREDAFLAAGHAIARYDVMYNDFVLVGPTADPAHISGMATAGEALAAIATAEAPFASRGDDSGTHTKELDLWKRAGLAPTAADGWYQALGQGMGDTLTFANETGAYTLTDRATFLAMQANLPNLAILVGGLTIAQNQDGTLLNPYGVLIVNPDKGNIQVEGAQAFAAWLTSLETQKLISEFGLAQYGQPLFYPDALAWRGQ